MIMKIIPLVLVCICLVFFGGNFWVDKNINLSRVS